MSTQAASSRRPMHIIGTAGHVDHGKSSLVTALTGIDPDRLAEEKAREMTIDLGFAWFTLADGQPVGVVDVPGHRDFIENMLAGIGGIDAALLVIAADEGVMPQTREHLHIIDLLEIKHSLLVLTKTDLIDDAGWLTLIQADIRAAVSSTLLANAPILPVSARTGNGMDALKNTLVDLLAAIPPRVDLGRPRLPVDRVFTMKGFGTVLTGTLSGGVLRVGDEVELQPRGLRGRIRGLQSYQQTVEIAHPGSRTAVNIGGIDKADVQRGDVLALPGQLVPTQLIDVWFRHLPDVSRPLKHDVEVKLFVGAAQTTARVRLIGFEALPPGESAWLQLRLAKPLAVTEGDRFILRYPSPSETIGGGNVVDDHPPERWKRFSPAVIDRLTIRAQGTPAQRLAQAADSPDPIKPAVLQNQVGLDHTAFTTVLAKALDQGLIHELPDHSLIAQRRWQAITQQILDQVRAFHEAFPLRGGIPREELRSRLGVKQAVLTEFLSSLPELVPQQDMIAHVSHEIRFTPAQSAQIEILMRGLSESPFAPPSFKEIAAMLDEDVPYALIERGDLVQVQPDVVFTRAAYNTLVTGVLNLLDANGSITASQLRDQFATSRKYVVALLEYLDSQGVTKRNGDVRVRGARSSG